MANWNKLNKEFDNLIDNLTDEQWNEWLSMKETHKAIDGSLSVSFNGQNTFALAA